MQGGFQCFCINKFIKRVLQLKKNKKSACHYEFIISLQSEIRIYNKLKFYRNDKSRNRSRNC